jgi:hypothetical protein
MHVTAALLHEYDQERHRIPIRVGRCALYWRVAVPPWHPRCLGETNASSVGRAGESIDHHVDRYRAKIEADSSNSLRPGTAREQSAWREGRSSRYNQVWRKKKREIGDRSPHRPTETRLFPSRLSGPHRHVVADRAPRRMLCPQALRFRTSFLIKSTLRTPRCCYSSRTF